MNIPLLGPGSPDGNGHLRRLLYVIRTLLVVFLSHVDRLARATSADLDRETIRWVLARQQEALSSGFCSNAIVRFEAGQFVVNDRPVELQGDRELALIRVLAEEARLGGRFVPTLELASRMGVSTPGREEEAKHAVERAVWGIRNSLGKWRFNRNIVETAPRTEANPGNSRPGRNASGKEANPQEKSRGYRLSVPRINITWEEEPR